MPPKKAAAAGKSKKAEQKAKEKTIVDKTFGLKNKGKSKKVQKYIQTVETQVNSAGSKAELKKRKEQEEAKKLKQAEQERKREIDSLIVPVIEKQKIPEGADPKSILCQFHKQGKCTKGNRCKFSHDLSLARKTEKINVYSDRREGDSKDPMETNENWDDEKLASVVSSKQTTDNKNLPTEIICKYFLEAIENKKYGWFWECENGAACKYRHALPPGYKLKSKKKEEDEDVEEEPLEDLLEQERAKITTHTPMNLERFLEWKEKKAKQAEVQRREAEEKRKADIKAGKSQMSGREMFVFNPDIFVDDDMACEQDAYKEEEEELDVPVHVIEATGTSLTRIAITKKEDEEQKDEQKDLVVDESLFDGDVDIPDEEDEDEDEDDVE